MVARINTGKSIKKALNYNEYKVKEGQAEILSAHNFLKDPLQLNFHEKLATFQKFISLNERTTTNTLHVSLNFDPAEQLENEKLVAIAESYMNKIGFSDQPWLVYRHFDTGHPHIHIVSINICKDGNRISLHNMGRNQSELARKEIEIQFGLVKAESKKLDDALKLKPVEARRINPGKRSTKAAISNVLANVITQYKYSSLAELNAILKLYNVVADRCGEDSYTFKHNGLLYRVFDEKGNKMGTPIKASLFYMKPTMRNLEKKFIENKNLKQAYKKTLKTSIDWVILGQPKNLKSFAQALEKEKISLVVRQNDNNVIYGLTYIDHNTKCVFNGSDIGSGYSAKAILEKLGEKQFISRETSRLHPQLLDKSVSKNYIPPIDHSGNVLINLMDTIISPSKEYQYLPFELKRQKKKKRKTP